MTTPELLATKDLDPAAHYELDGTAREAAAARLQMILHTVPVAAREPAARRPRGWQFILPAGLAAAALGVALAVLPSDVDSRAYASWTSTAAVATASDLATASEACASGDAEQLAQPAIGERRGDWVMLSYTTPRQRACLIEIPAGTSTAGRALISSTGSESGFTPLAGEYTQGGISQFTGENLPPAVFTSGDVGSDVTRLTIRTGDGTSVLATITDGHWAAWWPGTGLTEGGETGRGGPEPTFTVTLTFRDGNTITDARESFNETTR
ncbi:hypothetical protein C5D34_14635 [Rathayibacter sp. AY1B1]|uniref:hypothetical protein n=1 Tax=unclassified Rathayibacter TaxID=2609250 RepID=UPI000CE74FAA|nr:MULTISPECIES: hypothetical protein [unclassified Rathayibacter]PPI18617.1 hypothetical protein C5D08_15945 [Rathayibacter sp. AY1B6]PPI29201.1 hypothetical protein C5D34_14635 [Rathayibacter sp. AY1B1]